MGFPGGSDDTVPAYNAGDLGSIPRLGRCPGEGNGYPLQYSDLENSRGTWQATVHGVTDSIVNGRSEAQYLPRTIMEWSGQKIGNEGKER